MASLKKYYSLIEKICPDEEKALRGSGSEGNRRGEVQSAIKKKKADPGDLMQTGSYDVHYTS